MTALSEPSLATGDSPDARADGPPACNDRANRSALDLLFASQPRLIDVRPAIEALPDMTAETILVSGPPMAWSRYTGGQRRGIVGAVLYEGLASSWQEAERALERGDVRLAACHDHELVGSLAGITSASMPVLVVEDAGSGTRGHCTLFEGASPARLNYGVWNDEVMANLRQLATVIGPTLSAAVRAIDGGIALRPIMERALNQGDELHSRSTAASLLFLRELTPALFDLEPRRRREIWNYLTSGDYFFLRLSMAAAKSMADRMYSAPPRSSIVTAMAFSCQEFGIRVAGLGDQWFRGPLPTVETCQLNAGFSRDDIEVMGGESLIMEVCGLGAFAQAAAPTLQAYQGGSSEALAARNLEMYGITAAEHPSFRIPQFGYRGTPVGIDARLVATSYITPALDVGIAGSGGGQIGAGSFRAPLEPFADAWRALQIITG